MLRTLAICIVAVVLVPLASAECDLGVTSYYPLTQSARIGCANSYGTCSSCGSSWSLSSSSSTQITSPWRADMQCNCVSSSCYCSMQCTDNNGYLQTRTINGYGSGSISSCRSSLVFRINSFSTSYYDYATASVTTAAVATPSPPDYYYDDTPNRSGPSGGVIAGIVIGIFFCVGLSIFSSYGVWCCWCRPRPAVVVVPVVEEQPSTTVLVASSTTTMMPPPMNPVPMYPQPVGYNGYAPGAPVYATPSSGMPYAPQPYMAQPSIPVGGAYGAPVHAMPYMPPPPQPTTHTSTSVVMLSTSPQYETVSAVPSYGVVVI